MFIFLSLEIDADHLNFFSNGTVYLSAELGQLCANLYQKWMSHILSESH